MYVLCFVVVVGGVALTVDWYRVFLSGVCGCRCEAAVVVLVAVHGVCVCVRACVRACVSAHTRACVARADALFKNKNNR